MWNEEPRVEKADLLFYRISFYILIVKFKLFIWYQETFLFNKLNGSVLLSEGKQSHVLRIAFYDFLIKDEKDNSQVSFREEWCNKRN